MFFFFPERGECKPMWRETGQGLAEGLASPAGRGRANIVTRYPSSWINQASNTGTGLNSRGQSWAVEYLHYRMANGFFARVHARKKPPISPWWLMKKKRKARFSSSESHPEPAGSTYRFTELYATPKTLINGRRWTARWCTALPISVKHRAKLNSQCQVIQRVENVCASNVERRRALPLRRLVRDEEECVTTLLPPLN